MTDLERFFRRIVSNLAAIDPSRLRGPVPLADVPASIVPYRTNRRALHVDTSEEYEMVLLRLCAGEGGFIRTDPEEVRQKFEAELRSPNPDLEVIHRFENVFLTLRPERVNHALRPAADEDEETSIPASRLPQALDRAAVIIEEEIVEDEVAEEEELRTEEGVASQCVYCGGMLPDRPVNFCPHCGQSQVAMVCPECHADIEAGWRHCVNCGLALGGR